MNKDWTGNRKSTFTTLGASSHAQGEREKHDFYATDPICAQQVIDYGVNPVIWEPACGMGHLSRFLMERGYCVRESDLIDRGGGDHVEALNFLTVTAPWNSDIVTNPPYKYAQEFVEKALELIPPGRKVFMFLKITFLEGKTRRKMFDRFPPKDVLVYSSRQRCAINGNFALVDENGSAACYAWFVWEKGWYGAPSIRWV